MTPCSVTNSKCQNNSKQVQHLQHGAAYITNDIIETRAHSIGRSLHNKTRPGSSVAFCVCYSESLKFYMWVLQFSLCALCYNCYKLDQQNEHTSVLKLLMLPNCHMFRPSPAHHQLLQLYKQSLDHTVICNIRHCGEIISVLFTEVNMYTVPGAHHRLGCVQVRPETCSSFGKLIIIEFCWPNM